MPGALSSNDPLMTSSTPSLPGSAWVGAADRPSAARPAAAPGHRYPAGGGGDTGRHRRTSHAESQEERPTVHVKFSQYLLGRGPTWCWYFEPTSADP